MALLSNHPGRRGRRRRPMWIVALVVAVAGLLTSTALFVVARDEPSNAEPPAHSGHPLVTRVGGDAPRSWPAWGFTHTHYSAGTGEPGASAAVREAISVHPMTQAQSIMGWGVDNPEPARDHYDFGSLDRRMSLIRETHGIPVITLCCAPDWMKGGPEGRTDWSRLEMAPLRRHFDEFAELAAKVARRYPDVKHYVVWNEFKGFFDEAHKRWDAELYTALYNKVYTALKAVGRDIKVGGPYVPMNGYSPSWKGPPSAVRGPWGSADQRSLDAVQYWLKHKKGADFIVVDGSSVSEDRGVQPDEFTALGKFSAVTTWLRSQAKGLPVWWAEWYVTPEHTRWSDKRRDAVQTVAMMELVRSGAATALYWNPQRRASGDCPGCLWTTGSGGEATAALDMLQRFTRWFPPGTPLVDVPARPGWVRVLAQNKQMVVVNTRSKSTTATVGGKRIRLGGHKVRWMDR
ncbi:MAG TPA: xylan 1,4-beta-xylosidase [Actinomadura sp.]|nr:xylan 1,4-beta-xylosidase [Actinomadura sp.]